MTRIYQEKAPKLLSTLMEPLAWFDGFELCIAIACHYHLVFASRACSSFAGYLLTDSNKSVSLSRPASQTSLPFFSFFLSPVRLFLSKSDFKKRRSRLPPVSFSPDRPVPVSFRSSQNKHRSEKQNRKAKVAYKKGTFCFHSQSLAMGDNVADDRPVGTNYTDKVRKETTNLQSVARIAIANADNLLRTGALQIISFTCSINMNECKSGHWFWTSKRILICLVNLAVDS